MTSILNLKCFWNESCWILGLESKRPDNWSGFFGRFPHIPCKTRLSVWWRKQSTNHQSPIWMIACFAPVGPLQDPSLLATLKCFSSPKGNCDTNLAQSCSQVKLTFISSPEKPLVTEAKLKELSNIYHLNPPRNLTLIPFLSQTWSFGQHSNKNCTLWVPNMEISPKYATSNNLTLPFQKLQCDQSDLIISKNGHDTLEPHAWTVFPDSCCRAWQLWVFQIVHLNWRPSKYQPVALACKVVVSLLHPCGHWLPSTPEIKSSQQCGSQEVLGRKVTLEDSTCFSMLIIDPLL